MRRSLLVLLLPLVLFGCDLAEEPFRPQVVVNTVLVAGEPLPAVRLTQTIPLGVAYDAEALAVRGARVSVARLAPDGTEAAVFAYEERSDPESGTRYEPLTTEAVVPLARYRLRVEVPEALELVPPGAAVVAEALVPDTFRVLVPPPAAIPYDPRTDPPRVRVSRSAYPGRQSIYLFSVEALDPETFGLTPAYEFFLRDEEDLSRFYAGTSPLLNEASYELLPDGSVSIELLWLSVVFYGPNRYTITALDNGLYDFLRSQAVQRGSGTLAPGEIPEVLTNVRNGTGVFGATAQQQVEIFFER